MSSLWGRAREAQTSLKCPECDASLLIARSCHDVIMRCAACGASYPLRRFIAEADSVMEDFLENVYVDRM